MLTLMANYTISMLIDEEFGDHVDAAVLEAQATRVLAAEAANPGSEVGVVVTDDDTVKDLNRRFRGKDEATDVLSFGSEGDVAFPTSAEAGPQLGEVVISFPTALRQADADGRPVIDELKHLLTHGILHIVGYDHETAEEEREMQAREEGVLDGWQH
jgi:probable rRNA maturation factor